MENAAMFERSETCPICTRVILLSARDSDESAEAMRLHLLYGCDG
ncbi:hypothetical protein ACIBKY_03880 [Nonomuraea sp. NPDC050394]